MFGSKEYKKEKKKFKNDAERKKFFAIKNNYDKKKESNIKINQINVNKRNK